MGLSELAARLGRPLAEVRRQHALEAVLRRVAAHPLRDSLLLRGGLLARLWAVPARRDAEDVDFLALAPLDRDELREQFREIVALRLEDGVAFSSAELTGRLIWEDTPDPGLRLSVPARLEGERLEIQVDIGFGDPVVPPPGWLEYPALVPPAPRLLAARPETGVGWKLHGLFEREDGVWRPKDLHDLWLFLRNTPLEEPMLVRAIETAFSSRDAPLWRTQRLLAGRLGRSPGSRSGWRRFQRDNPERGVPDDLPAVVAEVAARLRPSLEALGCADPPPFPVIERIEPVLAAIAGKPEFMVHEREGGLRVVSYERQRDETFPDPERAITRAERERRLLLRECRGLTFDAGGRLLSRKFHKFFLLTEEQAREEDWSADPPAVLEKLDGSLISPLLLEGAVVWTTRRGPSPIAAQAAAFAAGHPGRYEHLARRWLGQGWTPLFEWCSRQRRIVLDYPESQLVLTAIRRDRTGEYLPVDEAQASAADFGVPSVRRVGACADPLALLAELENQRESEGYVLRFRDGRMLKLKTPRYRLLHQATEGPARERALWQVILDGEDGPLPEMLPLQERARFPGYAAALRGALAAQAAWAAGRVAAERARIGDLPPEPARKALALALQPLSSLDRRLCFAVWSGEEPARAAESLARGLLGRGGGVRRAREWLGAPAWEE